MRIRKIVMVMSVLMLAFAAWANDGEPKKKERRVIVIGDGAKLEVRGDAPGFHMDGVKRGFLGVSMVGLTSELRSYFGVTEGVGVLVSEVQPDGPAAKAGLKGGDVIVAVDGQAIDGPSVLGDYIRQKKGGDQIRVEVKRKGATQQFFVTLDERDVRRFEVRVPEIENWIERSEDGTTKIIELGEGGSEALDRMRVFFESPEFKSRVEKMRGDCSEYQERLQEIETRMKDLEKKLEKLK